MLVTTLCRRATRGALIAGLATGVALAGTPAAQAAAADWQVVAHRGGSVWGPEHTRATFKHMLDVGADSVEFDVQYTKDRVPVVFHDDTLGRMTTCRGKVSSIKLKALQKCDTDESFGREFRDERVLTLGQTLNFLADRDSSLTFFIHFKGSRSWQAKAVCAEVKNRGLTRRSIAIASSETGLSLMKGAGFSKLGYVFNDPAGWDADYPYLIPYNVTSTDRDIQDAQALGKKILPVDDHPYELDELAAQKIDGVLANDLDYALELKRTPPAAPPPPADPNAPTNPGDASVAGASGADSSRTAKPRTTGPMDF